MRYRSYLLAILWASALLCLLSYCRSDSNPKPIVDLLPYHNLHDTVSYVGMETCRSCHQNIYDTFIQTGMGQSFDHATHAKSAAHFGAHTAVYDSISDFYYRPFWRNDSMWIAEYRLGKQADTTHYREQYIKYIIGSGQHTNSHIYDENGYLYQAPITFYTQKGIWDLAPGFSGGFNSRFHRIIGMECMTCHNSLPQFVAGSENKYLSVASGIGCERCHGPGEAHVKDKLAGNIVDTAQGIDYTIVNPRHLPRELQLDVCRRCHLQGVSVLQEGKEFADFRPAMPLNSVMDTYLPEYDGAETHFIMASQAHRLTKSACYKNSQMTCLNCHNPHVSVQQTPKEQFNKACLNCHLASTNTPQTPKNPSTANNAPSNTNSPTLSQACSMPLAQRVAKNNNDCSGCHMPPSPSIDIPHVTVHDHFIRRPIADSERNAVERFIGLVAASGGSPTALSRAKGYLHYFESYDTDKSHLDSAAHYLQQAGNNLLYVYEPNIHLRYLQGDFAGIVTYSTKMSLSNIRDAWTAYRIGEAFWQQQGYAGAVPYLERAVELLPLQADFNNKLGAAYLQTNQTERAQQVLESLLRESPNHVSALTNLGYLCVAQGKLAAAEQYYLRALQYDPDYTQALLNMTALKMLQQQQSEARRYIAHLLHCEPNNAQAKALWERLK